MLIKVKISNSNIDQWDCRRGGEGQPIGRGGVSVVGVHHLGYTDDNDVVCPISAIALSSIIYHLPCLYILYY